MEKGYNELFELVYDYDISMENLKPHDIERKNANDFSIIMARFTLWKLNVVGANKVESLEEKSKLYEDSNFLAYSRVRKLVTKLAELGDLRATALYLRMENPVGWKDEIKKSAYEILSRDGSKTPEEWEVVASIYSHEKIAGTNRTADQLSNEANLAWKLSTEACMEKLEDLYTEAMTKFVNLSGKVSNSKFGDATRKALLGYYARYFRRTGSVVDLDNFMRLSNNARVVLLPDEVKKEYSREAYCGKQLCKLVEKDYKKSHGIVDLPDELAYAHIFSFYDNSKPSNRIIGESILKRLSDETFMNEELNTVDKQEYDTKVIWVGKSFALN